jgi:hypothetical protein
MKRMIGVVLGALLALGVSSCGDLLSSGCGNCPSGAHWERTCLGWISPVCDTYCVAYRDGATQLLDECCCGDKALPPAAPASSSSPAPAAAGRDTTAGRFPGDEALVDWRALKARYQ